MITSLKGQKVEINPTTVIVDVNGVGYEIKISLRTYSKIKDLSSWTMSDNGISDLSKVF